MDNSLPKLIKKMNALQVAHVVQLQAVTDAVEQFQRHHCPWLKRDE